VVARSGGKTGAPGGDGPADWIDGELRETKARLHKVESELAQALKQTYGLEGEMRRLMESLAVSGSVETSVGAVREEVRQMREQMGRLHDRQGLVQARVDQVISQRQQEHGRDRHEVNSAVKQIEAINRILEQSDARTKLMEESLRHVEDEVAGMRLANQAIDRGMEEMTTRAARTHEAALRLEQESNRVAVELARLEQTDDALTERAAAHLEQLRRAFERLDKLESLATFADEVRESLQRATIEREQLGAKVAAVERVASQLVETSAEFGQALAKVDQRSQNQAAEVMGQASVLADLTDQTKAATKKMYQMLLRQRRRRSEALNQEIKELTAGEVHASD
jgi:chromosome segregation ATPase